MTKVTAKPLKRMKIGKIAEKPDLVVLELETRDGLDYYTLSAADLNKVIDLFRQRASGADTANGTKIEI